MTGILVGKRAVKEVAIQGRKAGVCGEYRPLTYRLGLDLFVCQKSNETPGLGGHLVQEFVDKVGAGETNLRPWEHIAKEIADKMRGKNGK